MFRRWLLVVTGLMLCHFFASPAPAQDSTVHTLCGSGVGHKDNPQQGERYGQQGQGRQMANGADMQDQMPPDPADGEGLPGLGGTPLPKKNTQPTNNNSTNSNPVGKNGLVAPNAS